MKTLDEQDREVELAGCQQRCEEYEKLWPGAMYSNPEWGYPSGIDTVRTYPQYPWLPLYGSGGK